MRISLKRPLFIGSIIYALVIFIVSTGLAIQWINKPFAGFLLEDNFTVPPTYNDGWTGFKAGIRAGDQVVAVNGHPLRIANDLQEYAKNEAFPLVVTIKRQEQLFDLAIAPSHFTLMDFLTQALSWLLFGMGTILIGLFVIIARPKEYTARVHFLFCLTTGIFSITNFESVSSHYFSLLNLVLLPAVGTVALHVAVTFPQQIAFFKDERRQVLLYLPLGILCPLIPMLYPIPPLWDNYYPFLMVLAGLGVLSIAVFSLLALFRRDATPRVKSQARIILFGNLSAFLLMVLTSIAPLFGLDNFLGGFSYLFMLLFPLSIAYAIVRHRLFEIQVIVKKTVVYTLVTAALGSCYFLLVAGFRALLGASSSEIANILSTAAVAVMFAPLRDRTKTIMNRVFFRNNYNLGQVLSDFSERARLTFDANELAEAFMRQLDAALHPSAIAILLQEGDALVLRHQQGLSPSSDILIDPEPLTLKKQVQRQLGIEAACIAPLSVKDDIIGWAILAPRKSDLDYKAEDRELLSSLAQQLALWLVNAQLFTQLAGKERMQRELEIAHEVQVGILPAEIPDSHDVEIAAASRPALEVGGDLYDIIRLDENHLGFFIGDVSGKGVPAALLMAMTLSIFRTTAHQIASPAEVLAKLNTLLCLYKPSAKMFVTALYAIYDEKRHTLRLANAGHSLPRAQHGEVDCRGVALGILQDVQYDESEILLNSNETVLFYTDGLEDALNPEGVAFGEQFEGMPIEGPPNKLIEELLGQVERFAQGESQFDDITLVSLRRRAK